jgi:hypothetical protein
LLFRRNKAVCSEQIAALNISTKITIDDAVLSVLRKHKLL